MDKTVIINERFSLGESKLSVCVIDEKEKRIIEFHFYRHRGTPEIRRARAYRRAVDYCVHEMYSEFKATTLKGSLFQEGE